MVDVHFRDPGAVNAPDRRCYSRQTSTDAPSSAGVDERNDLVLEHLPLVKAIAARCRSRLPAHVELSDLVQAGILGLLDAAHKYQQDLEVSFATYATRRIEGAILDNLRNEDPAARQLRRRHRDLENVRNELTQELKRFPTESEVSERSGIDLESLRATARDIHHVNQMLEQDSSAGAFDQSEAFADHPEEIYQGQERAWLVRELIEKLPECYRIVITMHYMTNLSLKTIGGSFGVPERQVSRMHTQALDRIHAMLRTRGITARSEL
jgi:RNA polymerase sigma factor for flagellar operon FliA